MKMGGLQVDYEIKHEVADNRHVVKTNETTSLIIQKMKTGNSWVGVTYNPKNDSELSKKDIEHLKNSTYNEVIDYLDIAIVTKTESLPKILRELALSIEEDINGITI